MYICIIIKNVLLKISYAFASCLLAKRFLRTKNRIENILNTCTYYYVYQSIIYERQRFV